MMAQSREVYTLLPLAECNTVAMRTNLESIAVKQDITAVRVGRVAAGALGKVDLDGAGHHVTIVSIA